MSEASVLITGCRGQLGSDLLEGLSSDYRVDGIDIDDLDLTDAGGVFEYFRETRPKMVVHAAAYTDVDGCESNVGQAMTVNGTATRQIALACRDIGAKMIYYSTDYVFDGAGRDGRGYVEEDRPDPQTVYGRSKLAGEKAIAGVLEDFVVLRIAWTYGATGSNFVKTMVRLGKTQIKQKELGEVPKPLQVVDDQIGNPTWTVEVVRQTQRVIRERVRGLCHATSEGSCSWYEFARDVFEELSMDVDVEPCSTDQYPRPAPRPKWSVLENARLKAQDSNVMRDYRVALREFISMHGDRLLDEM